MQIMSLMVNAMTIVVVLPMIIVTMMVQVTAVGFRQSVRSVWSPEHDWGSNILERLWRTHTHTHTKAH